MTAQSAVDVNHDAASSPHWYPDDVASYVEPESFEVDFATVARRNARNQMEDFTQAADWDDEVDHPLHDLQMLAIFDGHGDFKVAEWLSENIKHYLSEAAKLRFTCIQGCLVPAQIEAVLRDAFITMDQMLRHESAAWRVQGSTAVVVIISKTHVVSANVGDSLALLWNLDDHNDNFSPEEGQRSLVVLTKEHKPAHPEERRRIEAVPSFSVIEREEHGKVESRILPKGWVRPNLNLSRAFGDFHCKPYEQNSHSNPVTVEPFIKSVAFENVGSKNNAAIRKSFILLLASDGVVNDNFTSDQALAQVHKAMKEKPTLNTTANALAERTLATNFAAPTPSSDWKHVARSLTRASSSSAFGDNQSVHVACLTQVFAADNTSSGSKVQMDATGFWPLRTYFASPTTAWIPYAAQAMVAPAFGMKHELGYMWRP